MPKTFQPLFLHWSAVVGPVIVNGTDVCVGYTLTSPGEEIARMYDPSGCASLMAQLALPLLVVPVQDWEPSVKFTGVPSSAFDAALSVTGWPSTAPAGPV